MRKKGEKKSSHRFSSPVFLVLLSSSFRPLFFSFVFFGTGNTAAAAADGTASSGNHSAADAVCE